MYCMEQFNRLTVVHFLVAYYGYTIINFREWMQE